MSIRMNMTSKNNALILTLGLIFAFFCTNTFAECFYTNGGSYITTNITIGTVIVQRDTPVGSTLATQTATVTNGYGDLYICNADWSPQESLGIFNVLSSIKDNVYNTNITGVGIRITDTRRNRIVPSQWTAGGNFAMADTPFTVELVKTTAAGVSSGNLNAGAIVYLGNADDGFHFAELKLTGVNKIVSVACKITTPNLTFPMGSVPASEFGTKIGFIPTETNTQNLGLNCDAGANINVELNGTHNPDVTNQTVLALNGQGTSGVSSGLGVQLLYNGAPLQINTRMVLKKSAGGQDLLPIVARYYQTKTAVTPGDASTSATLTLTYQ